MLNKHSNNSISIPEACVCVTTPTGNGLDLHTRAPVTWSVGLHGFVPFEMGHGGGWDGQNPWIASSGLWTGKLGK